MIRRIPRLYSIAAVGNGGQIGYNNALPWDHQPDDMKWFREMTTGGILLCGKRTYGQLASLDGTFGRDTMMFLRLHSIDDIRNLATKRTIWVCGGSAIYHYFAPFVSRMHFGMIDYDGPADTFYPRPWYPMTRSITGETK